MQDAERRSRIKDEPGFTGAVDDDWHADMAENVVDWHDDCAVGGGEYTADPVIARH